MRVGTGRGRKSGDHCSPEPHPSDGLLHSIPLPLPLPMGPEGEAPGLRGAGVVSGD